MRGPIDLLGEMSTSATWQMTRDALRRAAPEWLAVYDDVLLGLNHALNNRMAAIGSLASLLEFGEETDSLLDNLIGEISALESTVELLGRLPAPPDEELEPIRLEDLVPRALELHRLRRDTRDLDYRFTSDVALPPAFAAPAPLTRVLLLVLGDVANAVRDGRAGQVDLHAGMSGEDLVLSIRAEAGDAPVSIPPSGRLEAASALVEALGGRFDLREQPGGNGGGVDLILPAGPGS